MKIKEPGNYKVVAYFYYNKAVYENKDRQRMTKKEYDEFIKTYGRSLTGRVNSKGEFIVISTKC